MFCHPSSAAALLQSVAALALLLHCCCCSGSAAAVMALLLLWHLRRCTGEAPSCKRPTVSGGRGLTGQDRWQPPRRQRRQRVACVSVRWQQGCCSQQPACFPFDLRLPAFWKRNKHFQATGLGSPVRRRSPTRWQARGGYGHLMQCVTFPRFDIFPTPRRRAGTGWGLQGAQAVSFASSW